MNFLRGFFQVFPLPPFSTCSFLSQISPAQASTPIPTPALVLALGYARFGNVLNVLEISLARCAAGEASWGGGGAELVEGAVQVATLLAHLSGMKQLPSWLIKMSRLRFALGAPQHGSWSISIWKITQKIKENKIKKTFHALLKSTWK